MKKSSYYSFAKLNPVDRDELRLDDFCKDTMSFVIYSIEKIRSDVTLLEGVIVFSRKVTIWEASEILKGMTISEPDDFVEKANEIANMARSRTVNKHPALSVKVNLMPFFDEDTIPSCDEDSVVW